MVPEIVFLVTSLVVPQKLMCLFDLTSSCSKLFLNLDARNLSVLRVCLVLICGSW